MFKTGDEKIAEGLICDDVNFIQLVKYFLSPHGSFFLKMYLQLWIKYWEKNVH